MASMNWTNVYAGRVDAMGHFDEGIKRLAGFLSKNGAP